ncbi:hypothetical protein [Actinoplanes sp. NPDC026619]|uniref:hypothetical protein n=1 Tax=Actinoplanes sp. NPDC026619 TaxID=3155798 RepID=UPI0033C24D5D
MSELQPEGDKPKPPPRDNNPPKPDPEVQKKTSDLHKLKESQQAPVLEGSASGQRNRPEPVDPAADKKKAGSDESSQPPKEKATPPPIGREIGLDPPGYRR